MKKNFAYAAFTALLLFLCVIPSLGMLLAPKGGEAGGNQAIARVPSLRDADGNWNSAYLSQIQDYAADNFYLRQDMITAWSALNSRILGSSITESVVLGRDGWLYFGETLPDYAGLDSMTERERFSIACNLRLMQEYCERTLEARFLFLIAPNKNSLYPEHMPGLTPSPAPHNAELLPGTMDRYKEWSDYLDLFALFREQEETLYFQTDSHWNSKGAALAADAINNALGRESAYFDGPFAPAPDHKGDLYDMLYPAGDGLETDQVYSGTLEIEYDAPIRSAENLTIMTHGSGTGSLVMFRDSFGNLLYPYMADSFDAALFSRSMPYRLDLAAQREADYVVVELVERNLRYLIQNVPVMPAPERREGKGEVFLDSPAVCRTEPSDTLPGYVLVTGSLPVKADESAPVCVSTSSGSYQAFLLENGGFGLYLPEDARPEAVQFYSGGSFVQVPC